MVTTPLEPLECHSKCAGCKTSDGKASCKSRMVVYKLVCLVCLEQYLGETYREFWERIKEHLSAVSKDSDDLTISTHFRECHPDVPITQRNFNSMILKKCYDCCTLKIAEALLISDIDPSINKYSGKWALI